jgi:hypothetical protein
MYITPLYSRKSSREILEFMLRYSQVTKNLEENRMQSMEAMLSKGYIYNLKTMKYINTYRSRFIPEEVAEVYQTLLRNAHVLKKILSYEEFCRRDRW